jgi:hypothetical protein
MSFGVFWHKLHIGAPLIWINAYRYCIAPVGTSRDTVREWIGVRYFARTTRNAERKRPRATSPSTKAQWLLFAEEWLKQAEAAEDQPRRQAAISAVAPPK